MRVALCLLLLLISTVARAQSSVCTAPQAVPLDGAVVLGNGTPASVTTATIQAALDAGGVIRFNVGSAPVTIPLTQELVVSRSAVFDGGGLVTLAGAATHRVFRLAGVVAANQAYTFRLQNLALADGNASAYAGDEFARSGGLLLAQNGGSTQWQVNRLFAVNVRFRNGSAVEVAQDGGGGALYLIGLAEFGCSGCVIEGSRGSNGGGLYTLGTPLINLVDSEIRDNVATGNGGNPGNGGNAGGVGVDGAARVVNLCRTRLIGNQANAFGGGFFSVGYDDQSHTRFEEVEIGDNTITTGSGSRHSAGAYLQGVPFSIARSLIRGNSAPGIGGVFIGPNATGEIVNSTFHANIARTSLAGALRVTSTRPVTMRYSTVAENRAECDVCFHAGISLGSGHQFALFDSILWNNVAPAHPWNPWAISGTVSGARVVQWPQTRPVSNQAEPAAVAGALFADAQLQPLADNGGPTRTLALPAGSPAIGLGQNAPATDQRRASRDATPDLGAYERAPAVLFASGFEAAAGASAAKRARRR